MPLFLPGEHENLDKFAATVWGNSAAVLKRHRDINYIDLQPYFALKSLFAGALQSPFVLARDEYRLAYKALLSPEYNLGAYVTGQPGIGKTLFIIYMLVVLLGQKRAVALQLPDGRNHYALFHATVSFHSFDDLQPLAPFLPMWAFSDSNSHVLCPSGIFLGRPQAIRIVQTTSPKRSRWKRWSEETGASCYIMDIWNEKEIGDLATLLRLDAKKMIHLASKWGCVPRTLLAIQNASHDSIKLEYMGDASRIIRECEDIIPAIAENALPDGAPSKIFFCRPRKTARGIDRMHSCITVPTTTIRDIIGEKLLQQTLQKRLSFFHALRQSGDTAAAAGAILESIFHSLYTAGRTIECNWVGSTGDHFLERPTTLVPTIATGLKETSPPYFWIAPSHFPGVDSVLVSKERIYAFQVTVSTTHKPPLAGMTKFHGMLPSKLQMIPWSVVFIGDMDNFISAVARQWAGRISFLTERVPIAWSVVDLSIQT